MPVVFTQRIIEHKFTTLSPELIYVAPGGTQIVLRELCLTNFAAATAELRLWLNVPGNPQAFFFLGELPALASSTYDRRVGLNAGDQIYGVSATAEMSVVVTAYVFST